MCKYNVDEIEYKSWFQQTFCGKQKYTGNTVFGKKSLNFIGSLKSMWLSATDLFVNNQICSPFAKKPSFNKCQLCAHGDKINPRS